MNQERIDDVMRTLVGYAYPNAQPTGEGRFVRRWVLRFRQQIPEQADLDNLAEKLSAEAREILRSAYGERLVMNPVASTLPIANIVRVTSLHCVVSIESPDHDHAVGDDAAVGTWRILQGIDRSLEIDDLEGIPKRFWFPLGGASTE
jgi:hypothetical protein